jgi:hypothetical protein
VAARDPSTITLDEALAYQNDLIPLRFLDDWDVSLDEARLLFDDVKRWLWLNSQTGWELTFVGPVSIIDEMFHMFILFTHQYRKYCDDVFGEYVDHIPMTATDKKQRDAAHAKDHEGTVQRELEERERMRRLIAERLGVDVLLRWWVDYPANYGDEFFRTRRKAHRTYWKPDAALLALAAEMRE